MEPVGSQSYHNLSPKEEASHPPTFPKSLKYLPQHSEEEESVEAQVLAMSLHGHLSLKQ